MLHSADIFYGERLYHRFRLRQRIDDEPKTTELDALERALAAVRRELSRNPAESRAPGLSPGRSPSAVEKPARTGAES